jgi:hypothetical protein
MMILRKLLSMSYLLTVGACESGSDALDSSENLIASPHNVVQALTLDVPWSCWQVSSKEGPQKLPITALEGLRQLKAAECENRELNANYSQQTRITVAVYMPSLEVDNIVYMRAVPLYFSNRTINQAASKLLLLGGFPAAADTSTAIIESATGRYKVGSYLRAIRTTTPLIVFLPMKIQGKKITPAIYEAACSRVKVHVLY